MYCKLIFVLGNYTDNHLNDFDQKFNKNTNHNIKLLNLALLFLSKD